MMMALTHSLASHKAAIDLVLAADPSSSSKSTLLGISSRGQPYVSASLRLSACGPAEERI